MLPIISRRRLVDRYWALESVKSSTRRVGQVGASIVALRPTTSSTMMMLEMVCRIRTSIGEGG